jgi:pyruvate/2-oxoglutarate dehydrogenase complex dihydrolipoamide acyltransferase (E2) component
MTATGTTGTGAGGRITRADIEAKLRQVRSDVEGAGESARGAGQALAPVAVAVLLGLAYLLGKRRGRRKSTVVEVRRL